ncbi:hypothetical protein LTR67_002981 [Exophiala xenobiotica]
MSNQPFTFPPPPPPPPKRTTEPASREHNSFPNNRGSFRGAGSYRGSGRGGGRGGYGSNQNVPFYSSNRRQQPHSNKPFINNAPRNAGPHPSQKRDHQTAFNQPYQARPRPTAAPAVPSFNASIEHLLPRKPASQPAPQPSPRNVEKPKKQNLLGLTPTTLDHDSEPEDDEDEEGRLASQTKVSHGLEIDHGGQQIILRTPADVAAWLAERRKRYPTQAKVEAAKKEAEEKKRKRQEEKAARMEAERQAREKAIEARRLQQSAKAQQKSQQQERNVKKSEDSNTDMAAKARLKAEKLRLKALKAQERLAKAEEALRVSTATSTTQEQSSQAVSPDQRGEQRAQPEAIRSTSNSELTDSDATSSSGSSTSDSDTEGESTSDGASDSDSAPEVISTKRAALEHEISAPPPPRTSSTPTPQICRAFARYGRCKFGSKCRHLHDTSKLPGGKRSKRSMLQRPETSGSGSARRKGLWQVMVEKEQEDERKKLLGAIITLGERGLLDEPRSTPNGHGRDGASRPVNTG